MNIRVQAVNFEAKPDLHAFIEDKYRRLKHYFDKITHVEVYLKVHNTAEKENKTVETRLSIPGEAIVIKKQCRTFEEGTDLSLDALKRQIQRHKQRTKNHQK